MKRNASWSETRSLAEELAALRGLDATALKQRWRALYRTEAPVRIGRTLVLTLSPTGCRRERSAVSSPPPVACWSEW
jgi:hypothetical protein